MVKNIYINVRHEGKMFYYCAITGNGDDSRNFFTNDALQGEWIEVTEDTVYYIYNGEDMIFNG